MWRSSADEEELEHLQSTARLLDPSFPIFIFYLHFLTLLLIHHVYKVTQIQCLNLFLARPGKHGLQLRGETARGGERGGTG